MKKLLFATVIISLAFWVTLVLVTSVYANQDPGTLKSTISTDPEDEVNRFNPGDAVYVKGLGLMPNSRYKIYIVTDQAKWVIDTSIPNPVPGTEQPTVTTDSYGNFGLTLIWSSAAPGYYDIIADCQDHGTKEQYDVYDSLDDFEVGTAGFFVISESALGTIGVLSAAFAAVFLKHRKFF
jgi:hypothetical protein